MTVRKLGGATIEKVEEICGAGFKPARMFPNFDQEAFDAQKDWMVPDHVEPGSDRLVGSVHTWVVKTPRHTILIDTCLGNHKDRHNPGWNKLNTPFFERLAACGCKPESVDFVMCTHLHVDHVGWNTRLEDGRWVPTFPNARYVFSREAYADSVLPVVAAGLADIVESATCVHREIEDGIWLEAAAGHSPGNVVVNAQRGGSRVVFMGDVIHHPIQLVRPDLPFFADEDPVAACATRTRLLAQGVDNDAVLFPPHFPDPPAGRVRRAARHFSYGFL